MLVCVDVGVVVFVLPLRFKVVFLLCVIMFGLLFCLRLSVPCLVYCFCVVKSVSCTLSVSLYCLSVLDVCRLFVVCSCC